MTDEMKAKFDEAIRASGKYRVVRESEWVSLGSELWVRMAISNDMHPFLAVVDMDYPDIPIGMYTATDVVILK